MERGILRSGGNRLIERCRALEIRGKVLQLEPLALESFGSPMRKSMRAIYVLLLSTSVAASTINGTLPAQSSTSALASTWPTVPSIGFSSSDDSLIEIKSYVTGFSYAEGATSGIYTRTVQCTSVDDVACASSDSIFAQLILPPCSATATEMCIESLEVSDAKDITLECSL